MKWKATAALLMLAATTTPVLAADYSLRAECARVGLSYMENRIVESVGTLYAGRAGNESFYFKIKNDSNYFMNNSIINPVTSRMAEDSMNKGKPINLCIRAGDGYAFGTEFVN